LRLAIGHPELDSFEEGLGATSDRWGPLLSFYWMSRSRTNESNLVGNVNS